MESIISTYLSAIMSLSAPVSDGVGAGQVY